MHCPSRERQHGQERHRLLEHPTIEIHTNFYLEDNMNTFNLSEQTSVAKLHKMQTVISSDSLLS